METAERAGGTFSLESEVGVGTTLTATLNTRNVDCLPLGDISGTVLSLILLNPEKPDFLIEASGPAGEGSVDTRQVREVLGGIPLNEPDVAAWLKDALTEEIDPIFGGVII